MSKPESNRSQNAITGPTPGPWAAEDTMWLRPGGRPTGSCNPAVLGPNREVLATVWGNVLGHETAEANARLISAAPSLLAACQDLILALAIQDHKPDWLVAMLEPVRDAVAKAEGGKRR